MGILVTLTVPLLLIAIPVTEVSAEAYKRLPKRHVRHASPQITHKPRYPRTDGWYVHDANKLSIGSARWWEQMRREARRAFRWREPMKIVEPNIQQHDRFAKAY
jgi:hypothetical protein